MNNSENKAGFDSAKIVECPCCGLHQEVCFNKEDYEDWQNNEAFIQDAFDYLSPCEREALMSGKCDDCWKQEFEEIEDEWEEIHGTNLGEGLVLIDKEDVVTMEDMPLEKLEKHLSDVTNELKDCENLKFALMYEIERRSEQAD